MSPFSTFKLCHIGRLPFLSVLKAEVIVSVALTSLLAPIVAQADPSQAGFATDIADPSQAAAWECIDWAALIGSWYPSEPRHGRMTNTCTRIRVCPTSVLDMADTGCACLCSSCACTLQHINTLMGHT